MVEESLAAGRRYFTLKALYQEMVTRSAVYQIPPMNRTRLKNAILQRFSSMLKEEEGFRNEVVFVCSEAMKDIVTSSLVSTCPSEDIRTLSKAALICRREMSKDATFDILQNGFLPDCQKNFVPGTLKYLIGLIMFGPSHEKNFENEQATLSIAQLITLNAQTREKHETPLPIYLGLLIHSKFRSEYMVEELHRLGLSISYNRVKYLEHKIGHSVLEQFAENLVCPTEIRFDLFTVGAIDNIDHNPSARTSKDSFHGTAISLFQARLNVNDGRKREFLISKGAPGKFRLSDDFTTLPQLAEVGLAMGPQNVGIQTFHTEDTFLASEIKKEKEWARTVALQIHNEQDVEDSELISTWSAYHGRNMNEVVPWIGGLFPLFTDSSSSPSMLLHAMELVKKSVNFLNPDQIAIITGDQPVYAIMKKLQWSHQSVRDMVVMMGGFHTEKHSIKAIGDALQGSGWVDILVEAGVASSGTADGMLNAVHVTKARYVLGLLFQQ